MNRKLKLIDHAQLIVATGVAAIAFAVADWSLLITVFVVVFVAGLLRGDAMYQEGGERT